MEGSPELPTPLEKDRLVVVQNERWLPGLGWSGEYLFYTDGPEWMVNHETKERLGCVQGAAPQDQVPPRGWVWTRDSAWAIEILPRTDDDGWMYSFNIADMFPWNKKCQANHFVRRRLWFRPVVYDPVAYLSGENTQVEASMYRQVVRRSEPITRTYEIYEHERWVVFKGFSASHLFPTDPDQFTDTKSWAPRSKDVPLSPDWKWTTEWRVEVTEHTDPDGWEHAFHYGGPWSAKCGSGDFVRRRKWLRGMRYIPPIENLDLSVHVKGDSERDRNFSLITGPLLQELASGDRVISTLEERKAVVEDVNKLGAALTAETGALQISGNSSMGFLDLTNKQRASTGLPAVQIPNLQQFQAWLAEQKTLVVPLKDDATDEEIVSYAQAMDGRVARFLQARELFGELDRFLQPGSLHSSGIPRSDHESEADL